MEPELDAVTRHVSRLRSRVYLLVVASLVVAYLLGVMLKPSTTYASAVQHAFNKTGTSEGSMGSTVLNQA